MRSKFPGYYRPTNDEFKELWEKALFVFDANVLLDLFRYSDDTVNALIQNISNLGKRVWIPYRVSLEYHRNLNEVISTQINSYKRTIEILEEFKKQLDEKRSHPFLDKNLHDEIKAFCEKFESELSKKKDEVELLITENSIKEKISILLDDKVGENFDQTKIDKICSDGVKRYADKCPPGYMDCKGKQGIEMYGDLIIWNEIIEKSKAENSHIILITGDVKEDWFLRHSGKTLGPRPELIHEFKSETTKLFYAYPTNQFLEYSNKYFSSNIDKQVIAEVEKVIVTEQKRSEISNTKDAVYSPENSTLGLPKVINATNSSNEAVNANSDNSGQTS
jgi:predicted nucleic acid-binding protein